MKCYACRKEIEEGRERCSACGFPVIYIVDEKDAENIRKMADDYRQSKLEGVSIELTAYQYAIENDELVLSEERSMPLFKGSQLNFDMPVWFEQDFAQIDTDEPLTLNITVAAEGKKTTHAVYGEAMAILAGDALLNLAYETAVLAFRSETESRRIARALEILSKKTGMYGMIGGQSVDVENEGKPLSIEQISFIYQLKTGALIQAAMMIGAVLAGADEEETKKIEKIAGNVGMAFQIQDDILDVTGDLTVLGKPAKSDEKNHKFTYAAVKGLKQAETDVEKYSREAVRLLEELPCENEFLRELILKLIHRNA